MCEIIDYCALIENTLYTYVNWTVALQFLLCKGLNQFVCITCKYHFEANDWGPICE